jgi:hypothetical protein
VRVAGNGVCLVIVQTTKQDSTALAEGGGGMFTVNTVGVKNRGMCCQVDLGHIP